MKRTPSKNVSNGKFKCIIVVSAVCLWKHVDFDRKSQLTKYKYEPSTHGKKWIIILMRLWKKSWNFTQTVDKFMWQSLL